MSYPLTTIAAMARLYVEGWSPEYGHPTEPDAGLAPDEEKVDESVEVAGPWEPLPGADDAVPVVAFVDGVRRVDARLTIDDPEGPVPGICGSFAVGSVLWDRTLPRADVRDVVVDRVAVFTHGKGADIPPAGPQLVYRTEAVPDTDPASLVRHFHDGMRRAEAALAEELARGGFFVVADGPINDLSAVPKVGFIKSHRAPYLSETRMPVIGRLRAGERTPLFTIGQYRRYSWYLRLADLPGGHSWTGVVRCEASAAHPLEEAQRLADRTAAILPAVASETHIDPRAPQNLVPIGALERELRRRLGDPGFVYRQLRSAVMREEATI